MTFIDLLLWEDSSKTKLQTSPLGCRQGKQNMYEETHAVRFEGVQSET